jgi:tungstate transport system substrate-binding protein
MEIWKRAGYLPEPLKDNWYIVTKTFMGKSLKIANDEKAHFMTDSSTWIMMEKSLPNLKVLFKGDEILVNVYHALCRDDCNYYPNNL